MPYRLPPRVGYDLSDQQLARSNLVNPLRDFLRNYASRDRVYQHIEFTDWGDAANFTLANSNTGTNFTVVDALGGVIRGTTAATATSTISAIGKTQFQGNNNCMVEGRFKIDTTVSTYAIEFGWINAAATTGATAVVDIDVPTFFTNITNAALFGIWNNQTHANFAFASIGSFTSQTVATTLLTTSNSPATAPTDDTYLTVKVLLLTDPDRTGRAKSFCWLNGKLVASHVGVLTGAEMGSINGQAAVYPWLLGHSIATTNAKVFSCDYIRVSQDRAALSGSLE